MASKERIPMQIAHNSIPGTPLRLSRLRVYVNGANPHQLLTNIEQRPWTLPLNSLIDLLKFLDSAPLSRYAVIDGHEPILDEKPLRQLVANLRIYGWEPILTTRGLCVPLVTELSKRLEILSRAGLSWIHLELNGPIVESLGERTINALCESISSAPFLITGCYYLTGELTSEEMLRRLLGISQFNQVCRQFYIFPEELRKDQPRENDILQTPDLAIELIVGNKGTLALETGEDAQPRYSSLVKDDWREDLKEWFCHKEERLDVSV
jgi:hypothetical protein